MFNYRKNLFLCWLRGLLFFNMFGIGVITLVPIAVSWTAPEQSVRAVPWVRVKIDESPITDKKSWVIETEGEVFLGDQKTRGKKLAGTKVVITTRQGCFYVNGKPCLHYEASKKQQVPATSIRIFPVKGQLVYEGRSYSGYLELRYHDDSILLINGIELEQYVYYVVCVESMPFWPTEVQKVQAVLTRTYVLATIDEMERRREPYHIKNNNSHQVYRGHIGEYKAIRTAVIETQGLFLAYKGQPIVAMFDICCGGIIPKKMHGVDFKKAPYLARKYACKFCKHYERVYSWKAVFEKKTLEAHLQAHIPELKRLERIVVTKRDPAGVVHEVLIQGRGAKKRVSGKQWYKWFKEVKSFVFTIKRRGAIYDIHGTGTGHHHGYCQWGGKRMVDLGYSFVEILKYYYPDTHLIRLNPMSRK